MSLILHKGKWHLLHSIICTHTKEKYYNKRLEHVSDSMTLCSSSNLKQKLGFVFPAFCWVAQTPVLLSLCNGNKRGGGARSRSGQWDSAGAWDFGATPVPPPQPLPSSELSASRSSAPRGGGSCRRRYPDTTSCLAGGATHCRGGEPAVSAQRCWICGKSESWWTKREYRGAGADASRLARRL